jgi:hypothetical protein
MELIALPLRDAWVGEFYLRLQTMGNNGFRGCQRTPLVRELLAKKILVRVDRRRSAYSVEKLSERDRRKNPTALENLKFPRAEGTAVFDDLRAQIRSVRHTSRFPRIFARISIQLKNRFDPGSEFFNRIGQDRAYTGSECHPLSGRSQKTGQVR